VEETVMKSTFLSGAAILGLVLASTISGPGAIAKSHAAHVPVMHTMHAENLRADMRKLWEDHITYTRNYIVSALGGLPDTDAVVARLMKNQEDIGSAITPYYGQAAGQKLTTLLKEHIAIAADVVKAAKAGDEPGLAATQAKWSANGKAIAEFLSGANPNWDKATLEQMLQKHLDLTTGEVTGRLSKDWAADIRSYDEGHQHMLMFADTLTEGIERQFPKKFGA